MTPACFRRQNDSHSYHKPTPSLRRSQSPNPLFLSLTLSATLTPGVIFNTITFYCPRGRLVSLISQTSVVQCEGLVVELGRSEFRFQPWYQTATKADFIFPSGYSTIFSPLGFPVEKSVFSFLKLGGPLCQLRWTEECHSMWLLRPGHLRWHGLCLALCLLWELSPHVVRKPRAHEEAPWSVPAEIPS